MLAAIWLVPMAGLGVALPLSAHLESLSLTEPLPTVVAVGSRENDLRTAVSIKLRISEGTAVTSPTSGVVTSVSLEPGQQVGQGTRLADIDYRGVAAFRMKSPLVRELGSGDSGPDVDVLSRYLIQLGYLKGSPTGTVTWSMRQAISKFQAAYGHPQDGRFRPSYVAFVPRDVVLVGTVHLRVGDPVSTSTTIFEEPGSVTDVRLASATTGESLADFADEPVRLGTGYETLAVDSVQPAASEWAPLREWLEGRLAAGAVEVDDAASATPTYSGLFVALADAARVGTVPASSVYIGRGGTVCVFVPAGDGLQARSLEKSFALPGEPGIVGVDPDLIGEDVLRDAGSAPDGVRSRCG